MPTPDDIPEVAKLLAAIGHVMSLITSPSGSADSRALAPVEFDKVAVFLARMLCPRVSPDHKRIDAPLDLSPGFRGHGLTAMSATDKAQYLLEILRILEHQNIRYVDITYRRDGRVESVSGLRTFVSPPFVGTECDHLAGCIQGLSGDQLRAIGTHCSFALLGVDLGYEILQSIGPLRRIVRGQDVKHPNIFLEEAVRKCLLNQKFYTEAYYDISRHLVGPLSARFLEAHDPPEMVWDISQIGWFRSAVFDMLAIFEALAHSGRLSAHQVAKQRRLAEPFGYRGIEATPLRGASDDAIESALDSLERTGSALRALGNAIG